MKEIHFGQCQLKSKKSKMERFLSDWYYMNYKKEKMKHLSKNDKRNPKIKITEDIFSIGIWFRDKEDNEKRIFADGEIFLEDMEIDTLSVDHRHFMDGEFDMLVSLLKKLTRQINGFIFISQSDKPMMFKDGFVFKKDDLKKIVSGDAESTPEEREGAFDILSYAKLKERKMKENAG